MNKLLNKNFCFRLFHTPVSLLQSSRKQIPEEEEEEKTYVRWDKKKSSAIWGKKINFLHVTVVAFWTIWPKLELFILASNHK